jgi:hypothetical protein
MSRLRRLPRQVLTALVALLLLFEEWGWEPLAILLGRLGRLPGLGWIERQIAALPPWAAVAAFALPALALFPVKLLALFLLGQGHALLGVTVLVAAKILGTAVLARLFTLTQPALMRLGWFARWYPRWKNWKDGVMAQVRASATWRAVAEWKAAAARQWASVRARYGLGPPD